MATRSIIGVQVADGTFRTIYCHWDGYPENNGAILLQHYQDRTKVEELVSIGGLSSLAPNIGTKHDFDAKVEGECNFYTRDRQEENMEAQEKATIEDCIDEEFTYIFTNENKWVMSSGRSFKPLTREMCGLPNLLEKVGDADMKLITG